MSKQELVLDFSKSFIESQFPVAKISMESYKERKSGRSQTITGVGKWWGRKPLVLVRAAILGLLLPVSNDLELDREIFLKLLAMDNEGLLVRKNKSIPSKKLIQELLMLPLSIQERFIVSGSDNKLRTDLNRDEKAELQEIIFNRLPYSEKIKYCIRPEQIPELSKAVWVEVSNYFDFEVDSIEGLINFLSEKKYGRDIRVGDAFCGGGSIPFEAARLGIQGFGSDLNPMATALSWTALKVVGGDETLSQKISEAQAVIFDSVNQQMLDWGIEENSLGWRADAYLYCAEVTDPETGWKVPLSNTWVIAEKGNVIAKLIPDDDNKRYEIEIIEGASKADVQEAKNSGTFQNSRIVHPRNENSIPIDLIRKNMRQWDFQDIVPLPNDVFQERLICIRWVDDSTDNSKRNTVRHYRSPSAYDMEAERKALNILQEILVTWQDKGIIPTREIIGGYNTDQIFRERGWTYWHHLFTPRQLLLNGLIAQQCLEFSNQEIGGIVFLLIFSGLPQKNSKLCRWRSDLNKSGGIGAVEDTFANQALNTIYNPPARGTLLTKNIIENNLSIAPVSGDWKIMPGDARNIDENCEVWITDPPYADAVNYHELSEFFLAWYDKFLPRMFSNWYSDSKRSLAVRGDDISFKKAMVECYRNLTDHMPDDGMQLVMFTHQDAAVWADLSMILWASGLRVTAAWTIATETESSLKKGNYVQGTVLLVLRKRLETEPVFLDEINHLVEIEVRKQLDSMTQLDDKSDPNFGDADYQLAAYAAALRVLTKQPIYEIDPEREILRPRESGESNPIEDLIKRAVKIAADHLVPTNLDLDLWRQLTPMERFYLKGLEVESHGEYRNGVYQELARGFGANNYTDLLASTSANETRLKRPSEFGKRGLSGEGFDQSLMRQCLFAIYKAASNDDTQDAMVWLRHELPDYWTNRLRVAEILDYLANLRHADSMAHWKQDAHAARLLAGAVRNDHV